MHFLSRIILFVNNNEKKDHRESFLLQVFFRPEYFSFYSTHLFSGRCRSRNAWNEATKYFFSFLLFFLRAYRAKYIYSVSKSMKCLNNKLMIFLTDKLSMTISLSTAQLFRTAQKFIYEWLMTNNCHNKCIELHQLKWKSYWTARFQNCFISNCIIHLIFQKIKENILFFFFFNSMQNLFDEIL